MKTVFKHIMGLIFLFLVSFHCVLAQTNTYSVLKVTGSVYCERLKKDLQNGDKIMEQDKLKFVSADAYLVVISPRDGRKVVKPAAKNASSELKSLLTDIVSLEKKHTAVRGHDEETRHTLAMKKLKSQFNVDTLLILGSGKINFKNSDVALNDTAVAKARFRSGNSFAEKPVSSGSVMDLSKSTIGTPRVKVQLIYFPNVKKDVFDSPPESLGSFVPRYVENEENLKTEVAVVQNTFAGKKREEVVAEIKRYIEDEYGPVLEENLVQWLTDTNLLKP